jgi:hypothetical protein
VSRKGHFLGEMTPREWWFTSWIPGGRGQVLESLFGTEVRPAPAVEKTLSGSAVGYWA